MAQIDPYRENWAQQSHDFREILIFLSEKAVKIMSYDRRATEVVFGEADVEKLRKDLLTLLKSALKVTTYEQAVRMNDAIRTWRTYYSDLVFENLAKRTYQHLISKYPRDELYEQSKKIEKILRSGCWDLYLDMDLPFEPLERLSEYHRDGATEEGQLQKFFAKRDKWAEKTKRSARKAWKTFDDYFAWVRHEQKLNGADQGITVDVQETVKQVIEGVPVVLKGYDPSSEHHLSPEFLAQAIKLLKRQSAKVFPWMTSHILPLVVDYDAGLDKGGEYLRDHIWLSGTSPHSVGRVTHILAHEMGHHVWRAYLSSEQSSTWETLVRGDWKELDLRELLAKWPSGAVDTMDVSRALRDSDPILSLQIDTVSQGRAGSFIDDFEMYKREDISQLINEGKSTVQVPSHPVTGYGHKNPEETFCEVFGLLVGYGPQAVHEEVRQWLRFILPEARVASTYQR